MFNVGRRYIITHNPSTPIVQMETDELLPVPPPKRIHGKGLDALIDKIKTIKLKENKKVTF